MDYSILLSILGITLGVGIIGFLGYIAAAYNGIKSIISFFITIKTWYSQQLPAQRVLGNLINNNTEIVIFVRDLYADPTSKLYAREGINGPIGIIPNVLELWPKVESEGLSKILNTLGNLNKTKEVEILEMGKDPGIWDKPIIILGAQTQKCFDFYQKMESVGYEMNGQHIFKKKTGKIINQDSGYGYGIILKCRNPFASNNFSFLVGGFGTLGTAAATHYFTKNLALIGKDFKSDCFAIVVRASISAGVQSTERLKKLDIKFN